MVFQQQLFAAPSLDTVEKSSAWVWLQAGGGSPALLRLAGSGGRDPSWSGPKSVQPSSVCVCVCATSLSLHAKPQKAGFGKVYAMPPTLSAALGRAGAPSCREGGMKLEAGRG